MGSKQISTPEVKQPKQDKLKSDGVKLSKVEHDDDEECEVDQCKVNGLQKLSPYLQMKYALDNMYHHQSLFLGELENPITLRSRKDIQNPNEFEIDETERIIKKITDACSKSELPSAIICLQADLENLKYGLPYALSVNFGKMEDLQDDTVNILVGNNNETQYALPRNLNELLSYAQKSSYGDLQTQETKLNNDVRLSYEIRNFIELPRFKNILDHLTKHVSKFMFNGQPIEFVRNKINIYPVGGHFNKHVDTPRENNVGSLVVALPLFKYRGGDFVLWPTRESNEDNSTSDEIYCGESNTILATAFYSYCPHEVKMVQQHPEHENSARVTITYFIELDPEKQQKFQEQELETFKSLANAQEFRLLESLTYKTLQFVTGWNHEQKDLEYDIEFYCEEFDMHNQHQEQEEKICAKVPDSQAPERDLVTQIRNIKKNMELVLQEINCQPDGDTGGGLGIILKHVYSSSESKHHTLKGIDLYLYDYINDLFGFSYNVFVLPVLVSHFESYFDDENHDRNAKTTASIYRFTESDIEKIWASKNSPVWRKNDSSKQPLIETGKKHIRFIGNPYANGEILNAKEDDYVEYTGNECRPGLIENQYFVHALFITPMNSINNAKTFKPMRDHQFTEKPVVAHKKQKL